MTTLTPMSGRSGLRAARCSSCGRSAISAIAFPRLVDSELSAFRALAPVRAATELFGASFSLEPWRVGDAFGALSDLAAQAPAFTLEVGRDPARLAETVAGLLSA